MVISLLSGRTGHLSGGAPMGLSHLSLLLLLLLPHSPLPGSSLSPTSTHCVVLPCAPPAGPVLEDRPFVVVWNMPTARCHQRFNVHLDLGHFDIVETA